RLLFRRCALELAISLPLARFTGIPGADAVRCGSGRRGPWLVGSDAAGVAVRAPQKFTASKDDEPPRHAGPLRSGDGIHAARAGSIASARIPSSLRIRLSTTGHSGSPVHGGDGDRSLAGLEENAWCVIPRNPA